MLPGLKPQLCSPSIVAQLELVAAGAGLGILPDFMAAGETMWRYTPLQDAAVVATAVRRLVAGNAWRGSAWRGNARRG